MVRNSTNRVLTHQLPNKTKNKTPAGPETRCLCQRRAEEGEGRLQVHSSEQGTRNRDQTASTMSKPAANLKQFADLEGQYEILKQLGEGAYGVVAAAKDKASGDKVAIKRIKDAVEDKEQVLPCVLSRERQCRVASVVDAALSYRHHLDPATPPSSRTTRGIAVVSTRPRSCV